MKGLSELQNIGLTKGEVKIYEALLELGETTRTELAKKSGISPSKIYDVANRLLEKGIITSVKKNGIIHFSPADPSRINDYLDKKEEELLEDKKSVKELLPMLLSKYNNTKEKSDVEVFYGWEGLRTAYDDIIKTLESGDEGYVFGASLGQNSKQADLFFSQYYEKVKRAGFKVKIIFNEDVRGNNDRTKYYTISKKHEVRYLHQETLAEVNIYDNTVLLVLLLKNPLVIRISSKEAYDSYKKYFDSLWKQAKK
ncbi:hypothetical protein COU61_01055 [Candidatus Pacearchaeota archaeon CG10_big_fil_rev_8_21_14_0_10_35_13]|nr:MAG: hypothetical protein COU61_01055 [Candidatus Pacearchaeota archaeon CG10_big_fil_rev_8_21_14_0_10_35_13]